VCINRFSNESLFINVQQIDGAGHGDRVPVGRDDAEVRRAVVVRLVELGAVARADSMNSFRP
jgi:hypothetical protein